MIPTRNDALLGFDAAVADARDAVRRSEDGSLGGYASTRRMATNDETMALRDALRALIQAVEALGKAASS